MRRDVIELTETDVLEAFEQVPAMGLDEFAEVTDTDHDTANHALLMFQRKGLLQRHGFVWSLKQ